MRPTRRRRPAWHCLPIDPLLRRQRRRWATTRGLVDAVGSGAKMNIDVGECGYCQEFAGEAVVGVDPLPPFHPSCTCVAGA